MRKLIAGINMTLDGFCDHTAITPDEEIHQHYTELLNNADTILYGRITYQLMEYWLGVLKNPTGIQSTDEFAVAIDKIQKVLFSRMQKNVDWETVRVATRDLEEEVSALKQQSGKDILVGSPSLIVALLQLGLVDELQLCVHPVIVGSGMPLFKNITDRISLKLLSTKIFGGGAVILYYQLEIK